MDDIENICYIYGISRNPVYNRNMLNTDKTTTKDHGNPFPSLNQHICIYIHTCICICSIINSYNWSRNHIIDYSSKCQTQQKLSYAINLID